MMQRLHLHSISIQLTSTLRAHLAFMMLMVGLLTIGPVACGPSAAPPPPTRVPAPTFTPTLPAQQVQIDPNAVAATKAAQQTELQPAPQTESQGQGQQVDQSAGQSNEVVEVQPTDTPAPEPTATPEPKQAEAIVNIELLNVRAGPGLTHNIVGGVNSGQRYPITGKNQAGDWWEIEFNGQKGWIFGQLVTAENADTVALAAIIPTPPPPPPTPVPPTNTPVPPPPAPTTPPKPKYKFNIAVVGRCDPQQAGNWFEGKTYINGAPKNGYEVAFSYAPDGPVVAQITSGPHKGYEGWDTGYYSHIINAPSVGPKAGNWFVWIVDGNGARISEIANFQTTGPGDGCNQATVDFDSR
ncbi:SH3 domain-containing protein [Chloroflexi bacterium TSY]|nr:SH3 domain-containing protein [Chloroflexi bacterium TSY]